MIKNPVELAQRMQRDREEAHKAVAAHCPVPVCLTDHRGQWLEVNEPMVRLLAAKSIQLTGKQWTKLLTPAKQIGEYTKMFVSRPETAKTQLKLKTPDGRAVTGFLSLIRLEHVYLGFLVPCCDHPVNCPVHGFLLQNIVPE